jgi:hypothetical protein
VLLYNSVTFEIAQSASKTFVIDHPVNENKYFYTLLKNFSLN